MSDDYDLAQYASEILGKNGFEAYIVGGAVRDLWLGLQPKDFDLATDAQPLQVMAIEEFRQSMHKDTAQAFGITRVRLSHGRLHGELEIATFRKDLEAHRGRKATRVAFAGLKDDVLRRDLTINALALNPVTGQLIDYVNGVDDLRAKLIRFIGNPGQRIREDPLRIMRAIRFKTHLGFTYEPATARAIRKAVKQGCIEVIATDRLRDELTRLLIHSSRYQAVLDLDALGILERVLPEVTAGKGVKQPPQFHTEGDVWQHQLMVLGYLPPDPSKRLAWAALLHDIGKPPTATEPHDSGDRIRFNRHYAVGAEIAKTALRRLRFSNRDISDIAWMVYNHMAIDDLPVMRPGHQRRMLGHPAFKDLMELHRADAAASWRPGQTRHDKKPRFPDIERLWREYRAKTPRHRQPSLKRDMGIDGQWLMQKFGTEFGLSPGPLVGRILESLEEWYQDEGVRDKKTYLAKARQLLQKETGRPSPRSL